MIRQGIRPEFRLGLGLPAQVAFRRVFPFRRNWKIMGLLLLLDGIFLFTAVGAFQQAVAEWSRFADLFDLVTAVFVSAWLIGWSIAPLLITAVLVVLLAGREEIRANQAGLQVFTGLPLLGMVAIYELQAIRNLQWQQGPQVSGRSWRGAHLGFDYGANRIEIGSHLTISDASEIQSAIESASGIRLRSGEASAAELAGQWEIGEGPATRPDGSSVPVQTKRALRWSSPSSLLLILANLVPVAGAALFDWNLGEVMVLYWCESAIIGFFNVAKLIVISRWGALLTATFFLTHYTAFMAVHFLFIYTLFVEAPQAGVVTGGDLQQVSLMLVTLWPALLALTASHAYSFFANFLSQHEFESRSVKAQMVDPYQRIIFMHLVLIFGGGLSLALGNPTPVLLLVIALKIWVDVRAHIKEHASELGSRPL